MRQPLVTVRDVALTERPVTLRLPFRFGAVTLTEAPQVFVRVEVEADGRRGAGQSAELLAPKWFDKNPALTNGENFDQLRGSLFLAAELYRAAPEPVPAFALSAALAPAQWRRAAEAGMGGLVAGFGAALMERAVLDALCRIEGVDVAEAVRRNLPGITAHATPDLYDADVDAWLATRRLPERIAVRHTVGMADAITTAEVAGRRGDGLPESLEEAIAAYGHRHFKLKVGGDLAADVDRLVRIASVLDRIEGDYLVSLDGNEQFADAAAVLALVDAIEATPALERLWASTAYIEQPIARARALTEPVHALAARKPVAIDESDEDIGVFPVARALGYRGISSKSCKGFYRALLNAMRAVRWTAATGEPNFIIAEDLTTQAGVAVQQDLALAALTGATHVERNGHHYVDGFGTAPAEEAARFAAAHPDLYAGDPVRLRIEDGSVSLASLAVPGLGVGPFPDVEAMRPVPTEPAA